MMLYPPLGGGAVSRKAIESQCHHPLDKVKQQTQMLTHKMSPEDTKHPPSEFQHLPSKRPEIMVLPVWPQRWLLGGLKAA